LQSDPHITFLQNVGEQTYTNLIETGDGYLPHPFSTSSEIVFMAPLHDIPQLIFSYRYGFFPWYEVNDLAVFFYPHHRYVIQPSKINIPKSINSYFNQNKFKITIDTDFEQVINLCKEIPRPNQDGSWLSDNFILAYTTLHNLGIAHSVEVWDQNDNLAGGLYGVSLGKIFHGESMFSLQPNASRFGLISLSKILEAMNFSYIDCQIENPYLQSFGGTALTKKQFFKVIRTNLLEPTRIGSWSTYIDFLYNSKKN
jgi:leucyl/phenylalanyl-tRNA---protein transferase